MNRIIVTAALLLAATDLFAAQDWRGKVLDENGEPLQYANVALLSKADSSVLGGVTTEADGTYNIVSGEKDGILMVAMMGYQTCYLTPVDGATINLKPDNATLEGSVATAVMAKTKLTGEGLQTSVRGSILENIGTANDVLGRTPGIIKGQNGLEVIGKGTPLIYINGHKVTDLTELERLQSNDIQSVEVITNPGPQYDASVRSVVRIRTYRRNGEGFGFDINLKDTQSLKIKNHNDPNLNTNFNFRKNNLDVFAGINLDGRSTRQDSYIYSFTHGKHSFENDGTLYVDYTTNYFQPNVGMNWQIADNHSVGFKTEYFVQYDMVQLEELHNTLKEDGETSDVTHTLGNYYFGDTKPYSFNSNVYYNGQAGKLGIDFNFDSYRKSNSGIAEIDEESSSSGGSSRISSESKTNNNLYAAKLVFSYPVGQGQLQFGTEETFSRMKNNYSISGAAIPAASSKVKEDNFASFASYGFIFKGMAQFNAGLRYEHVNYSYDDVLGDGSFTRKYDNLFPTVSIAGAFGKMQMMLNFSEKTLRPGFGNLDNTIRYNSKYILESGNAALQPQTIRDLSLMANWKWLTGEADFSSAKDAIVTWGYPFNDEGVMIVKPCNLEKPLNVLTAYVNAAPTIGIWNINCTIAMIQQWLTIEAPDYYEPSGTRTTSFSNRPIFVVQMFNTLSFKHNWQLEFGGEFHSKGYTENVLIDNTYMDLRMAVQKAFLKDKSLIIRLEGEDLADLTSYDIHTDYGNYLIHQTNMFDNRRLVLSIRYRFNTARSKYKGTGAGQDAISRMK